MVFQLKWFAIKSAGSCETMFPSKNKKIINFEFIEQLQRKTGLDFTEQFSIKICFESHRVVQSKKKNILPEKTVAETRNQF